MTCPQCRAEVELLQERIRQFETLFNADDLSWEFYLTKTERRLLGLLKHRQPSPCSKESLMLALYFDTPESDEPNPKIIDIYVHKLRRKLKGNGFHIKTLWGFGYSLGDGEDPSENLRLYRRGPTAQWTPEEDDLIRQSSTVTEAAIQAGRTPNATWARAQKIGHRWGQRKTLSPRAA